MGQTLDKSKAFSYGRFVLAAYSMFLNPQGGDPLRPDPAGIPPGWELGAWIHMSDFILVSTLCTFASPRVGMKEFVRAFDALPINSWRIVNKHDLVPKLPPHVPVVLDYVHVDTEYLFDSNAFAKKSLECWHSMETYLHWLDPTSVLAKGC